MVAYNKETNHSNREFGHYQKAQLPVEWQSNLFIILVKRIFCVQGCHCEEERTTTKQSPGLRKPTI